MADDFEFFIDVFSISRGRVWLTGWVFSRRPLANLALHMPGAVQGDVVLQSYGKMPSPDVAQVHGPSAAHVRFEESFPISTMFSAGSCELRLNYQDGAVGIIRELGAPRIQRAGQLQYVFRDMLAQQPDGRLLEIGSRARSGITRREMVPEGWGYTGCDIIAGPNVDRVGDAHELSTMFVEERFDAVMAFSVLEHLLMPWKFILELNAVLNPGAIGCFTTHQSWPLHDAPWDFWRFSDGAWSSLLNRYTGFEIIEAVMGEPAVLVAQRCHNVTQFGEQQHGYLASNVLFRKIGPTALSWPVPLADVVATNYPSGEVTPP